RAVDEAYEPSIPIPRDLSPVEANPECAAPIVEKCRGPRFLLEERRRPKTVDRAGGPAPPEQHRTGRVPLNRADPHIGVRILVEPEGREAAEASARGEHRRAGPSQILRMRDGGPADHAIRGGHPPLTEPVLQIDLIPAPPGSTNLAGHERPRRRKVLAIEPLHDV